MVSSPSTPLVWTTVFILMTIAMLVQIGNGQQQYNNREARRLSKGCALWGQACLGGHFKKRANDSPSSSEVAALQDNFPASYPLATYPWRSDEVDSRLADQDRFADRGELSNNGLYSWNKLPLGAYWRSRAMATGSDS